MNNDWKIDYIESYKFNGDHIKLERDMNANLIGDFIMYEIECEDLELLGIDTRELNDYQIEILIQENYIEIWTNIVDINNDCQQAVYLKRGQNE